MGTRSGNFLRAILAPVPAAPVLLAAACAGPTDAGFDRVGPGYVTGGGEWSTGGGISAAVRVVERGGQAVVCGAWATDRQSALTLYLNDAVMEAAAVDLAGTRLVHGLGFMSRVGYGADITGAEARCVASPVAWRPEFAGGEPMLRFPRIAYPEDVGEGLDGGGWLIFRQTARPALVGGAPSG